MRGKAWRSCLSAVLALSLAAGCSSVVPPTTSPPPVEDRTGWMCPDPTSAVLPAWAREGFPDSSRPIPYLRSTRQSIVAVPFGWPLSAPTNPGRSNKILWIAKEGGAPLQIVAVEKATGLTATRDLPDGPGPSVVDMPNSGCWRFTLQWAEHTDEVFVRYS